MRPRFANEDHLKITVGKDTLHVSFKNKSFMLNNVHDLDSYLKKNSMEMSPPVVDLETFNGMTPEPAALFCLYLVPQKP